MTPDQVRKLPSQWITVDFTPIILAELMEAAIVRRDGVVVRVTGMTVENGQAMLQFTLTDDHAIITNGGARR